jgi:hypothetical protein
MGDRRRQEAIHFTGGYAEPVRRVCIFQPSISSWSKVPAERVLSAEAVMDFARSVLQLDFCGEQPAEIDDVGTARGQDYALLHTAGARCCHTQAYRQASWRCDPAWPRSRGPCASRRQRERREDRARVFGLFIGLGRGELLPYGPYYLTGFLNERPLARLREALSKRTALNAPNDSWNLRITPPSSRRSWLHWPAVHSRPRPGCSSGFFKGISPMIGRFFADLERADSAEFHRQAGTAGRLFMEIETNTFAVSA